MTAASFATNPHNLQLTALSILTTQHCEFQISKSEFCQYALDVVAGKHRKMEVTAIVLSTKGHITKVAEAHLAGNEIVDHGFGIRHDSPQHAAAPELLTPMQQ